MNSFLLYSNSTHPTYNFITSLHLHIRIVLLFDRNIINYLVLASFRGPSKNKEIVHLFFQLEVD